MTSLKHHLLNSTSPLALNAKGWPRGKDATVQSISRERQ